MGAYRLSSKADRSIARIYEYSVLNFGVAQAAIYFSGLHEAFDLIGSNLSMGRMSDEKTGVRRFVYRRHTIFYELDLQGVLILDLLGAGQDPSLRPDLR